VRRREEGPIGHLSSYIIIITNNLVNSTTMYTRMS